MRTKIVAAFAALATALGLAVSAGPAAASTGGTPDGDLHPNVGLILFYDASGGRFRCSATLVTPTVLLTAAHCTDGTVGKTMVTFESVIAEEPPSGLPAASDSSVGFTARDLKGYSYGTAHTHPQYSGFTDMENWNDVGVVVLEKAVSLPPGQVAPAGTLGAIPTSELRSTIFRAVGYGTEVRKAEEGPQNPQPMTYPLMRRYVDMPGQKLTPQILQTNGNENDTFGTGGTCFGDSGGPLYLGDRIVGVTSFGYTSTCRYLDGYQRVDIPVVQDWLRTFHVPV
ncbi:trypsin-like serine protease [Sinomonas mesophila]|uniref:trypsin-like serine protease n=1 Tax=Sinomonas mesophila TaxID=1531955 RepID=UPI00098624E3|nr:trypsin-like serine protease [Sinomonas mesophila]